MKIASIDAIHLRIEDPNIGLFDGSYDDCLIVVTADDGRQGIDGECRFESGPGRGTTFTATVPVAAPDGDPSDRTVTEPVVHGSISP
jgi:hypothetical protein